MSWRMVCCSSLSSWLLASRWVDGDNASAQAQSLNERPYDDRVYVALVARGMRSALVWCASAMLRRTSRVGVEVPAS